VTATILRGDARHLPLPDSSVDLIVTSPPFLNLRSYMDGGVHMENQIGTGTRDDFLAQLWEVTAEMKRVLKPQGSIFVELGDSYTDKCLNMTPHRYAIGCVDRLGLYKRAEIVWSRPNGLPESVTDRVRRSHSVVFHFVRSPRYYSAVDEVRESYSELFAANHKPGSQNGTKIAGAGHNPNTMTGERRPPNPLGKLPGSVWTIPTSPLKVPESLGIDHFAAFPSELVRRIVLGWSPREVCTACGEGRRPVTVTTKHPVQKTYNGTRTALRELHGRQGQGKGSPSPFPATTSAVITGYACACPHPTAPATPGTVLDPFGGTGTTALVADCFGRHGISVDLSADYCRLATWRTRDPGERARVLGVAKPPPVPEGQLGLFEGGAA
jgi:DNA modification methylase